MSTTDEDSAFNSQESEINDLKFRISQLEHLVVSNSFDNSSSVNTSLPSSSSIPNQEGLINRMSQLERLLAASELENTRLREEMDLLHVEFKKQHVEFQELLEEKDKEMLDLKYEADLYLKKNENYERKLKSIEDYMNTLPSEQELTSANQKVHNLELECSSLEQKVGRFEQKVSTLTKQLFHKESQYQDVMLKLEELKPLQQAHESLDEDEQLCHLDLTEKEEILKYITVLKAEIERSKKIIGSHRDKITHLNQDKGQYTAKINSQALLLNESREQYLGLQFRCDQLQNEIKALTERNADLSNKYDELKVRTTNMLQARELRAEQYQSVIQLVTEIDFCVSEMNNAIELGKRLLSGEEPDVDSILGLADLDIRLSMDADDEDSDKEKRRSSHYDFSVRLDDYLSKLSKEGDLNLDWCLERWENVHTARKELLALRNQLKDFYVEKLTASRDGCPIQ